MASGIAFDRVGSGPPVVLLHPLGTDRRVWRPVLPHLTGARELIAVDLPGFGASAPLPGPDRPTPGRLAEAVAALLRDDLQLDAPHVVGCSLGGWVALELALRGAASRVTAIAPAGLWGRPLPPKPEVARRLARAARPALTAALRSPAVRRVALYGSVAHADRVPPEDAATLVRAYADAPGFTAVNRAMRSGTFDHLADVDVPVTLVWPERDQLVARVTEVPPHMNEITLPDCGHIPMWDDPEAVAAAVLS